MLARHVTAPAQLAAYDRNFVGGDINTGSFAGTQLLFRPTVRLRSYRTPNPDIFLCSAATPPGGGVHGACGANAADLALRRPPLVGLRPTRPAGSLALAPPGATRHEPPTDPSVDAASDASPCQ